MAHHFASLNNKPREYPALAKELHSFLQPATLLLLLPAIDDIVQMTDDPNPQQWDKASP